MQACWSISSLRISIIIGKSNVGLYRDDGLAILKNTPGPDIDSAGYCWILIKVCYCGYCYCGAGYQLKSTTTMDSTGYRLKPTIVILYRLY